MAEQTSMVKITGLWKNKDKKGNTYLSSGGVGSAKFLIFQNTYKKDNPKAPDYQLYIASKPDKPRSNRYENKESNEPPEGTGESF